MSKKKIAILLPYKENYTNNSAGAASIWLKDYIKKSKLYNQTRIYGNIETKEKPLTQNFINIPINKFYLSKTKSYMDFFYKEQLKNNYEIIFLSKSQRKISNKFASSDNEVNTLSLKKIKKDSLGYMICSFYKKLSAGDHYIILHKVKTFRVLNDKKPLLFYKSKYC